MEALKKGQTLEECLEKGGSPGPAALRRVSMAGSRNRARILELAGKALGKDAAAGKETFVSLLGVEAARERAHMLVAQAKEHLRGHGAEADLLRAIADYIVERDR